MAAAWIRSRTKEHPTPTGWKDPVTAILYKSRRFQTIWSLWVCNLIPDIWSSQLVSQIAGHAHWQVRMSQIKLWTPKVWCAPKFLPANKKSGLAGLRFGNALSCSSFKTANAHSWGLIPARIQAPGVPNAPSFERSHGAAQRFAARTRLECHQRHFWLLRYQRRKQFPQFKGKASPSLEIRQGLVTVPFWVYWTSPYSSHYRPYT